MATKLRQLETQTWELVDTVDLIRDLLIREISFHMHKGNLAFVCDDVEYNSLIFLQE